MRDCQTLEAANFNLRRSKRARSFSVSFHVGFFLGGRTVSLEYPAASPEVDQKYNSYQQHCAKRDEVTIRGLQFRDVIEVHSINAGYES